MYFVAVFVPNVKQQVENPTVLCVCVNRALHGQCRTRTPLLIWYWCVAVTMNVPI